MALSADAKERRPCSGHPYNVLYEIIQDERTGQPIPPANVHRVLASAPSYVCKSCHSTLSKYHSIKEQLNKIRMFVRSAFCCTAPTEHPPLSVSVLIIA